MKRWLTVFSVSLLLLLSGCSFWNSASDTLDYVKEATTYLDKAASFSADAPSLIKQAVESQPAADDLKTKLEQMKKDVQSFNNLKVPETVNTFHQQLLEQNNRFITQIDQYLTHIKNGKLDPALLDSTDLLQPIQNITEIIEQIQTLGSQVNETLHAGA